MIDAHVATELAERIADAERTRTPTRQISQLHPEFTIDDAYAVQQAGVALAERSGRVVRARKIGLTSKVMQDAVGITEPDHGVIYADMFYGHGDTIPFDRFIAPRLEVELAFVLGGRPQRARVHARRRARRHRVRHAGDRDPRCPDPDDRPRTPAPPAPSSTRSPTTRPTRASWSGPQRFGPRELDLPWVAAVLRRNGVIEESGVAAAVLDHPATGVAWLADRLAARGVTLRAGELILAGSFTRPIWVRRGDDYVADYGPLGTIEFRFA